MQKDDFLIKANAYNKMRKAQFELEREYFNDYCDILDDDGYPTADALRLIENWHLDDPQGWFLFIQQVWYMSDWGWHSNIVPHRFREKTKIRQYDISTAGWSGNEEIIRAMQKNEMLWWKTHYQTRRGGHYIFEVEQGD